MLLLKGLDSATWDSRELAVYLNQFNEDIK